MNTNKLKYYIAVHGKTLTDVENALGIGKTTLYRKLSNKTEFVLSEIQRIITLLNLSKDEIMDIFSDFVS